METNYEKDSENYDLREQILIRNGKGANISDGLREMWKAEYEKYNNLCQEEVVLIN